MASARISGRGAIWASSSGFSTPPAERPRKTSASGDHVGERARVGLLRIDRFPAVHELVAALVDDALDVGDPDVLALGAERHEEVEAGERRGAGTRGDDLDVLDALAGEFERVRHRGADDDRRAVLVVVEDRDAHAGLQPLLDLEAFRRLDVLEIDAAEGRLERRDHLDELVDVLLGDLDVEDVDAGELLEQDRLALHHGLGGERADIAEAQHRRAVGDHRHEVLARGEVGGLGRVGGDGLAGGGDARGIGERQVALVAERLGRLDLELSGARIAVVEQRTRFQILRDVVRHSLTLRPVAADPVRVRRPLCACRRPAVNAVAACRVPAHEAPAPPEELAQPAQPDPRPPRPHRRPLRLRDRRVYLRPAQGALSRVGAEAHHRPLLLHRRQGRDPARRQPPHRMGHDLSVFRLSANSGPRRRRARLIMPPAAT